jgi:hypothetical protein
VLTEISEGRSLGEIVLDQRASNAREEYLAPVTRRAHAGGRVDAQPDVAVSPDDWLTGVEPHSHSHVDVVGPGVGRKGLLRSDGARDGILSAGKGNEQGVALVVDLAAVELGEHLPEQTMVLLEDVRIAGAKSLEQASRSLDVGEEKCDCARR